MSLVKPDTQPGAYYVSAIDGAKRWLLLGPFMNDHAAALARVGDVRKMANENEPRSWFYSFGTVRLHDIETYPIGSANKYFKDAPL